MRLTVTGFEPITDRALPLLARLSHLEGLQLSGTQITDEGLKTVARMTGLKWLDLSDTSVTDVGVSRLANLRNLERIDLERTRVTAASVAALARLPGLSLIMSDLAAAAPYEQTGILNSSGIPIQLVGLLTILESP